MNRELVFSPAARRDIIRLEDFIAQESPAGARRAVITIQAAADRLSDFGETGVQRRDGSRSLFVPFGMSGFELRYGVDQRRVTILRIWHGREQR